MGKAIKALPTVATGGLNLVGKKLGIGLEDEQGAYLTPEQKAQKEAQAYYADYDKNMGAATKGVQEGAFTKDVFGQGGLQSQLASENADLSSRGYSLQQPDYEAYGQASGDIARQFGQQEQDVSQSLARRGLGGGSSGAAGAAFSGLAGNKNEMLAKAQTNIAQKRMADTTQRLNNTRSMMSSLANQGTNLANSSWAQKGSSLNAAAGKESDMNVQNSETLAAQQAAIKPGLFSTIGQGLQRGIGQVAQQAPGMALGAATGGASMAGSPLAQKNKYGVDGAGGTTSMSTDYLNMR